MRECNVTDWSVAVQSINEGRKKTSNMCRLPERRAGGGTTPESPRESAYRRRNTAARVKARDPQPARGRFRLAGKQGRLPPVSISRAALGWGDDPTNPPRVGVPAPKESRAC